jgi:hypothetical protein
MARWYITTASTSSFNSRSICSLALMPTLIWINSVGLGLQSRKEPARSVPRHVSFRRWAVS